MIDYTILQHDDDGIPTWYGFLGVTLQVARRKDVWKSAELTKAVLNECNFSKELLEKRYPSKYHQLILSKRIQWAISYLTTAELLERIKYATYRITKRGIEISNQFGLHLTKMTIFNEGKFKRNKETNEVKPPEKEAPAPNDLSEQQVQDWIDNSASHIQSVLLDKLIHMDPYKFEPLMVHLLSVMGYQGDDGQALVTQKSNDGGIDGVINQDPLGLQRVYIQVKRYSTGNSVGRPEVAAFGGSIKLRHADRGVFITTSSFTEGAIKAAKELGIVLVNGEILTNLMIKYHVGVMINKQYTTYKIDRDSFE